MASSGVVSALGGPLRTRGGILIERYIRTDAIPYPGFSGGALIDTHGDLLGILTTGLLNSVALAIPTAERQEHRGYPDDAGARQARLPGHQQPARAGSRRAAHRQLAGIRPADRESR